MGWKEDLTTIVDQNRVLHKMVQLLQGQTAINGKRIENLKVLLDEQVKNQSRAADRMADRMIEMAMVNTGRSVEAASHRRTLAEPQPGVSDLWEENPSDQWPPPGCDAVQMP